MSHCRSYPIQFRLWLVIYCTTPNKNNNMATLLKQWHVSVLSVDLSILSTCWWYPHHDPDMPSAPPFDMAIPCRESLAEKGLSAPFFWGMLTYQWLGLNLPIDELADKHQWLFLISQFQVFFSKPLHGTVSIFHGLSYSLHGFLTFQWTSDEKMVQVTPPARCQSCWRSWQCAGHPTCNLPKSAKSTRKNGLIMVHDGLIMINDWLMMVVCC